MAFIQIEAQHRPIAAHGVFKYEDNDYDYGQEYEEFNELEEQITFSDLMKMSKRPKHKNNNIVNLGKKTTFRNVPKNAPKSTIKFATEKKLTIDPVISAMMRNIDSYQKHSDGRLMGLTEQHFQTNPFGSVEDF